MSNSLNQDAILLPATKRGDHWSCEFTFTQTRCATDYYDFTGHTAVMQLRADDRNKTVMATASSATGEITFDVSQGKCSIVLSNEQMKIPANTNPGYFFDIEFVTAADEHWSSETYILPVQQDVTEITEV